MSLLKCMYQMTWCLVWLTDPNTTWYYISKLKGMVLNNSTDLYKTSLPPSTTKTKNKQFQAGLKGNQQSQDVTELRLYANTILS